MSERTAVLFLVLCIAALLGLIELEKVFEEEKIAKKERQIAEIKKQKEDQKKAAELEDKIFKVRIKHDGRPETNTYPMILDATSSFDPDQGDRIRFSWKQLSGNKIRLRPNSSSGIVSFEGTPGEYTFELTVSDNYGKGTVITKTVKIEEEPNQAPIVDLEIRQGVTD